MKLTLALWPTGDGVGCINEVTACRGQLLVRRMTEKGNFTV